MEDSVSQEETNVEENLLVVDDEIAEAGDFTPLFNDTIIHRMLGILPPNCNVAHFNNSVFKSILHSMYRTQQKYLGPLSMTCKKFCFLAKQNKEILNNLIFQLLRPSKHTEFTASNIGLCVTAGADINYRNEWNETPLMYAISVPPAHKFIDVLIKEGAEVNQEVLKKAEYNQYDVSLLVAKPIQHKEQKTPKNNWHNEVSSGYKSDSLPVPAPDVFVQAQVETKKEADTNTHNLEQKGASSNMLQGISVYQLPILLGVVGVGYICYRLYIKYKTKSEHDKPGKDKEEVIAITTIIN
jgi:hypothetical protein